MPLTPEHAARASWWQWTMVNGNAVRCPLRRGRRPGCGRPTRSRAHSHRSTRGVTAPRARRALLLSFFFGRCARERERERRAGTATDCAYQRSPIFVPASPLSQADIARHHKHVAAELAAATPIVHLVGVDACESIHVGGVVPM